MIVKTYTDIQKFLAKTLPSLRENEAANNLMLGLALRLEQDPQAYSDTVFLGTVERDQTLVAAGLMTPPYNLIVHCAAEDCIEGWSLLASTLLAEGWEVPGVLGHSQHASDFAEAWQQVSGQPFQLSMQMRTFALHQVVPAPRTAGFMRPAGLADLQIAHAWWMAFNIEAIPNDPLPDEERTRQRIEKGEMFFWIDGDPVSMAATTRSVGKGISIGLVYTPPEKRRRGYAGALVAAVSQYLLDAGYEYCTLFTDLSNPTSNAIYQRIGYKPVCDYEVVRFGGK